MKSIPKTNVSFNFDYLPFSTVLDRKANTTIWILKQVTLFLLLIFFGFPFFRFSCVHLFCVLCFLKWKVSHVVLFIIQKQAFTVVLQNYYLAILHRYFCMVMLKRSTLQLYRITIFLAELWVAVSKHLINKCDQITRQVKNQIKHQIRKKN